MRSSHLVRLSELSSGTGGVLYSLAGGHHLRSRLASLGFTAGAELRVRQNSGHGPVLVELRGALVALGRGEAAHITVAAGD